MKYFINRIKLLLKGEGTVMDSVCTLCGNNVFKEYNKRENAQCTKCKSLERARYFWLIFLKMDIARDIKNVFHVAPELCLMDKFHSLYGSGYHACDMFPELYKHSSVSVFNFDYCQDIFNFPSSKFDLVVHNHVLEHLCCEIKPVIKETIRTIRPGGYMFFSVPFRGGKLDDGWQEILTDEERVSRFAQADHVRIFGVEDFSQFLDETLGCENMVDIKSLVTEEELIGANIPVNVLGAPNGTSVFVYKKPLG